MREFYVYILSNAAQVQYIGMTADLDRRMEQHMEDREPKSFVARYNLDRLVFVETYPTADQAITWEKQLKGWSRARKKRLILSRIPLGVTCFMIERPN